MRTLLIISALFFAVTTARADVWHWVDADGKEHFSDRPVEGATRIRSTSPKPPSAARPAPAADARARTAEIESRMAERRAETESARAVAQDLANAREQQCEQARDRYEKSIKARRIYRTAENGERVFLPDAEADALRLENRRAMEEACGTSGS